MLNKKLRYCPVCGNRLELSKEAYICSNENCSTMIMDNHIMDLHSILNLMHDDDEDKQEVSEDKQVKSFPAYISIKRGKPSIFVLDLKAAEEHALSSHDYTSVIISITSRGQREAFIVPNNESNVVGVLKLEFNDDITDDEVYGGITYKEAKQIADFVKVNSKVTNIIVQCEAGFGRSCAIAKAIAEYFYNDSKGKFDTHELNENCYKKVSTALMYD